VTLAIACMLATLTGDLCLLVGLAVLLLPLLATELSRPRDGAWGAVVLLLGLVLVTSNDRLRGAPMLAVACGALLIGRLGSEVAQARWQQLSPEEQHRLGSRERWASSLQQLITVLASLGSNASGVVASFKPASPAQPTREGASRSGKRWVRPESPTSGDTPQDESAQRNATSKDTSSSKNAPSPNNQNEAAQGQAEQTSASPAEPAAADFSAEAAVDNSASIPTGGADTSKGFGRAKAKGNKKGKRWVRPESPVNPPPPTQKPAQESAQEPAAESAPVEAPDTKQQQPEPAQEQAQSNEDSDTAPPAGTGQD
jgi:hypothetical protein